jgi:TetR/AcrR family transcriptional regulator, transcriptional repressor for nem operon
MARTVKADEYASKRSEILNAAQRLVVTRGYNRMSIQDILDEIHISSGAFHHYFGSRSALLEALIQHIQEEAEQPLLLIVHDPQLSALAKLQAYFAALDRMRMEHKATVVEMLRAWYTDDNALVRQKVDTSTLERRTPLLAEIIRQGIGEGAFATAQPQQAGEIILTLLQGMGNTHAKLLLSLEWGQDETHCVEGIVASYAAYMNAIEHVLGAPPASFERIKPEAVKLWAQLFKEKNIQC